MKSLLMCPKSNNTVTGSSSFDCVWSSPQAPRTETLPRLHRPAEDGKLLVDAYKPVQECMVKALACREGQSACATTSCHVAELLADKSR